MFLVTDKAETYSEGERVGGKFLKCLHIVNKKPEKKYTLREYGKETQCYVYTVEEKKDKRGAPLYILNPAKPDDFIVNLEYNTTTGKITGNYEFVAGEYRNRYEVADEIQDVEKFRELVESNIPEDDRYNVVDDEIYFKDLIINLSYTCHRGVQNPGVTDVFVKNIRAKTGNMQKTFGEYFAGRSIHTTEYYVEELTDRLSFEELPEELQAEVEEGIEKWQTEKRVSLGEVRVQAGSVYITYKI